MSQRPIHFKNIKENNTQTRILIASSRTFAAKFSALRTHSHANSKAAIIGFNLPENQLQDICSLTSLARPVSDVSLILPAGVIVSPYCVHHPVENPSSVVHSGSL